MHIYFSGIGGAAISALAVIAKQAGYEVSGSDARNSQYLEYLRKKGIENIHVGLTREQIEQVHNKKPIDWFVYGSAQPLDFPDNPEFKFVDEKGIKKSKRDELLNEILSQKSLKLIAIAGTHGKTTTTAMTIWVFQQLYEEYQSTRKNAAQGNSEERSESYTDVRRESTTADDAAMRLEQAAEPPASAGEQAAAVRAPISYSVGAKISFGDMGHYEPSSEYFVYEGDEFDRNFLSFHPFLSIIVGVAYDHHEIYPTQEEYNQAFKDFISQSQWTVLWEEDARKLKLTTEDKKLAIESYEDPGIEKFSLTGLFNRRDAHLVVKAISYITKEPEEKLIEIMNRFPGLSRRFEKITENLYTDYAHTPEKIQGAMSVAGEMAAKTGQKIVVIYEPLTNRRMHYTAAQHRDVFEGASAIYWVPSFLSREDSNQPVLTPEELIKNLSPELQEIAHPMQLDENLASAIKKHLQTGDLVVAMSGGSGGSLDEWLRNNLTN